MATIVWRGGADAVAQIASGSVDTFDSGSTYTITIGGYAVSVAGNADAATTAADLVAAANVSAHAYFSVITWSVPSGSTITATADQAGAPFIAALSVAGGTGAVTDFSDDVACTGPHHANNLSNWVGGALPTTADDVVLVDGPSLLYALDTITSALGKVEVRLGFTGMIGLERSQFATSADGATTVTSAPEYRLDYLELDFDEAIVGEHYGAGAPAGSPRICLTQMSSAASVVRIAKTGASNLNSRTAVRLLASSVNCDVVVNEAGAGVGLAVEPGDAATFGAVVLADRATATILRVSSRCTWGPYEQFGGQARIASAATLGSVVSHAGDLEIVGAGYTVTALSVHGGTVVDTHENDAGAEWGAIVVYGGDLDLPGVTDAARAFTTLQLAGGAVEADWSRLSGTVSVLVDDALADTRRLEFTG